MLEHLGELRNRVLISMAAVAVGGIIAFFFSNEIISFLVDYYPNASLVQEEHGVSVVRVCVDATGRIAALPLIETSSGYRRLDESRRPGAGRGPLRGRR